jgi:hypothetical protein
LWLRAELDGELMPFDVAGLARASPADTWLVGHCAAFRTNDGERLLS